MRVLGVTETCDLGALYMRLVEEGHEVRIHVGEPKAKGTLAGLVPHVPDWRSELDWIREAGTDWLILFEAVSEGFGVIQDELRRDGFQVIGGSEFGDQLENDRAFAQERLADLGFATANVREYSDAGEADAFIAANPGRYVFKMSGAGASSGDVYVGLLGDGSDVRAMLAARAAELDKEGARFILMDRLEGVEMGVGAYFNGETFLRPACLDWEHKRFFAGDMGELTGEMGTVATFDRSETMFERTLKRLEPMLREHGHVGYVNLNMIVNEQGLWPLEFTCRFGYPGFAVLGALQETGWGELLRSIATRSSVNFRASPGYALGIVLTTPPFPYSRKQVDEPVGLPVLISNELNAEDRRNLHFGEIGFENGRLVTSGLYGWSMVVTGTGETIGAAKAEAHRRAAAIVISNGRYRLDIGDRLIAGELAKVERLGLL